MLHALLHGKLDPAIAEPQRLEDALTSTTFGTLVMVEAWDLLASWLEVDAGLADEEPGVECWFWPRMAGGVEPDVVLRLGSVLVVVEAKYRSGRSDLAGDDEEERPVDQILRQYRAVAPPHDRRDRYPEPLERAVRECRIIQAFVVDGRRMRRARREHEESSRLLPEGAVLKLVTWQSLHKWLMDPRWSLNRWAADLRAYLALAGLERFHGVRRLIPAAETLPLLPGWTPFSEQRTEPGIRAAGAALAVEPGIERLGGWCVARPRA